MEIKDILDKDKTPIFACIGAKYSFYDNTSNRIGDRLKERGLKCVLNFNNINMQSKVEELEALVSITDKPQIIAIDLSHSFKHNNKYNCSKTGIKPGSGLGRNHASIGDVSIKVMLNAFEDIKTNLDIIMSICKEDGNKDIIKTEQKIADEICEFYGV